MGYCSTIINQIASFIPRHVFEKEAKEHHIGQNFRSYNRWSQFMAMLIGQLSGRTSLRDITENLDAQQSKWYHLGISKTTKTTLARVNEIQPASLYEKIFFNLLGKCQNAAPKHKFSFKNDLYLLDTTSIDLCLSVFPWATFRKTKGAIKLHTGISASGYLPTFMDMTDGKTHEVTWAKTMLNLPKGSFAVFDRGFNDYEWFSTLINSGVFFVTRLKNNADVEYLLKRAGRKSKGIKGDQKILLKGMNASLRLVTYLDSNTGKEYRFITNAHHLKAKEITEIYKERWQIELFFKWIKQNLKIKTFMGTSRNAVLTQVWIALIAYLLIAYLSFRAKIGVSMQKVLRVLQMNLFERRPIENLFRPPDKKTLKSPQLLLWE